MTMNNPDQKISLSDVTKTLKDGISETDSLRISNLEELSKLRQIKISAQQKEITRLQHKYGNEHPRVIALTQKIEANKVLTQNLDLATKRARKAMIVADENTWVLHGFVFNEALVGLSGLTIVVADEKQNWIEEIGHDCTDKTGYFKLVYKNSEVKRDSTILQVGSSQREMSQETDVKAQQAQTIFFVQVLDKNAQLLHADQQPITPQLGKVDYVEILLDEEANVCPSPFAENKNSWVKDE